MSHALRIVVVLSVCLTAFAKRPTAALPDELEIGRHTFFDFGPPFDYYEVLLVRTTSGGSSVERLTITPPGDECVQPARVETALAQSDKPVSTLLGNENPCAIPENELRRELKRRKKGLVFSGADVVIRVKCGSGIRMIRADVLDRDMFDPAANTPEHTTWTMELLGRLEEAVGPGVMSRPMFDLPDTKERAPTESDTLKDLEAGKFDGLFEGAPHRPSDLYRASQKAPPSVQVLSSTPLYPDPSRGLHT